MKKKLGIAAITLLTACSLVACKPSSRPSTSKPNVDRPSDQEEEIVVQPGTFKFEGKTTIKNVEYKCELHCYEDKTFNLYVLDENKVYSGTYSFTDGIGYKFIFGDSAVVDSVWNAETKSHEVTYKIRLGRKGSGNVTVSLKDDKFVQKVNTAFDDFAEKANFHFDQVMSGFHIVLDLKLEKDGTYTTKSNNEAASVYGGTYKIENNVLTLTEMKDNAPSGEVYTSTYDPVTSTYTLPGNIYVFGKAMSVSYTYCTRNLGTLTGSTDVMGKPGHIEVKILDDKNALFDFTWGDGGTQFDKMFDKEATYVVRGNEYVFTVGSDKFITKYDRVTGEHTLEFTLKGQSSFDYLLKGKLPGFGLIGHGGQGRLESDFSLDILGKNEAGEQEVVIRAITGDQSMNGSYQEDGSYKMGFMDKKGILKVAENGSLSITVGEKVYNLSFDDKTGVYSFDYELVGQQGTINATLMGSIWK